MIRSIISEGNLETAIPESSDLTMDHRPSRFDDSNSMSSSQVTATESAVPPMFSQHMESEFPKVGELPVPNVSPMTAHVSPLTPNN